MKCIIGGTFSILHSGHERLFQAALAFDEIELKQIFIDHAVYTHNFNGTQTEIQDKFYGEMGCNGTVSFKFTTPVYLWLLENL